MIYIKAITFLSLTFLLQSCLLLRSKHSINFTNHTLLSGGNINSFSISTDGNTLLYSAITNSGNNIYMNQLGTGIHQQLTYGKNNYSNPVIDQNRGVYYYISNQDDQFKIIKANLNSHKEIVIEKANPSSKNLSIDSTGNILCYNYSFNGRQMVAAFYLDENVERIYGPGLNPIITNDATKVVFQHDNPLNNLNIWILDLKVERAFEIRHKSGLKAIYPCWGNHSNRIFFITPDTKYADRFCIYSIDTKGNNIKIHKKDILKLSKIGISDSKNLIFYKNSQDSNTNIVSTPLAK